MESVRVFFTAVSFVTFIGIVVWAFGAHGRRVASLANEDLLTDDDRAVANGERSSA